MATAANYLPSSGPARSQQQSIFQEGTKETTVANHWSENHDHHTLGSKAFAKEETSDNDGKASARRIQRWPSNRIGRNDSGKASATKAK
jgi:hypothetical protein